MGFEKKNSFADSEARYVKMTSEPVAKLITSMAIPAIASQIVTSLYSLADTYFVSSLSASATAATGVAFPLLLVIQAISLMLAVGSGSLAARQLGAKKSEDANITISTSFFLSVFIGTAIGAVCIIFIEPIMVICGATETILPYACDYAFWIVIATPFYSASFVLAHVIRQEGNVRLATIGTVTGAVVNVVLDPLLIIVFKMGITGAAIATSLSQIVNFAILFSHIMRGKCVLKLGWRYFKPSKSSLSEVIKVGSPNLYQSALLVVAQIMLNNAAGRYGDAPLAGMTITNKVSNIIVLALMGFGQGFQPMCGFCYGAKMYSRVKEGLSFTIKICEVIVISLSVIAFIFAPFIIGLFRPGDTEVIEIGSIIFRAHLVVLPLLVVTTIANMLFISCGRALKASVMALARNGIVFIPLILLLPNLFGLYGVVAAQPAADVIAFFIALVMMIGEINKINILERSQISSDTTETER